MDQIDSRAKILNFKLLVRAALNRFLKYLLALHIRHLNPIRPRLVKGNPDALGAEGAMLLMSGEKMEGRKKLEESLAGDSLSQPARENYVKALTRNESSE